MNEPLKDLGFWSSYPSLYEKAARIQKECFPYSPEERGALFYALEVCGEVGELLNVCKKIIRTKDPGKLDALLKNALPEEAADCAIALTMLAQSLGGEPGRPALDGPLPEDLHPLLIALSRKASSLYAAAWENALSSEDIALTLDLLFKLSQKFTCDLAAAVSAKLDKIAHRALEKHYD